MSESNIEIGSVLKRDGNWVSVEVWGIVVATAPEALQWADASGGEPIRIGGKYVVCVKAECERLETEGVPFCYVGSLESGKYAGRIVLIPVNSD